MGFRAPPQREDIDSCGGAVVVAAAAVANVALDGPGSLRVHPPALVESQLVETDAEMCFDHLGGCCRHCGSVAEADATSGASAVVDAPAAAAAAGVVDDHPRGDHPRDVVEMPGAHGRHGDGVDVGDIAPGPFTAPGENDGGGQIKTVQDTDCEIRDRERQLPPPSIETISLQNGWSLDRGISASWTQSLQQHFETRVDVRTAVKSKTGPRGR